MGCIWYKPVNVNCSTTCFSKFFIIIHVCEHTVSIKCTTIQSFLSTLLWKWSMNAEKSIWIHPFFQWVMKNSLLLNLKRTISNMFGFRIHIKGRSNNSLCTGTTHQSHALFWWPSWFWNVICVSLSYCPHSIPAILPDVKPVSEVFKVNLMRFIQQNSLWKKCSVPFKLIIYNLFGDVLGRSFKKFFFSCLLFIWMSSTGACFIQELCYQ